MNSTTLLIYAAAYFMYPEALITSGVPAENLIVRQKTNGYQNWQKRSMWKVLIKDTEGSMMIFYMITISASVIKGC